MVSTLLVMKKQAINKLNNILSRVCGEYKDLQKFLPDSFGKKLEDFLKKQEADIIVART